VLVEGRQRARAKRYERAAGPPPLRARPRQRGFSAAAEPTLGETRRADGAERRSTPAVN